MKPLYESILDIDKLSNDTDLSVRRQYELPELLKKLYNYDWKFEDGSIRPSNSKYGGFWVDEKLFEILEEYKVKKIIFPFNAVILAKKQLKLTELEIIAGTNIEIRCSNLQFIHCKISIMDSARIYCNKISMNDCNFEVDNLYLYGIGQNDFKFGNSRMKVHKLYVCTSDMNWLEHLKNLGVKKTYTIDWYITPGKYSKIDPLQEFGFNPNQWTMLDKFGIIVAGKNLWGINATHHFQFYWARNGESLLPPYTTKSYKKGEYFKNWEQYLMQNGSFLS